MRGEVLEAVSDKDGERGDLSLGFVGVVKLAAFTGKRGFGAVSLRVELANLFPQLVLAESLHFIAAVGGRLGPV